MSSVAINIVENSIPRDDMANKKIDSKLYEYVKQDIIEEFKSRVQQHLAEKLVPPCGNSLLHVAVSYGSDNIKLVFFFFFSSILLLQNEIHIRYVTKKKISCWVKPRLVDSSYSINILSYYNTLNRLSE